jgi:type IV fimbrial biogenesis protein FimT
MSPAPARRSPPQGARAHRGLTLLELAITLAVLAVLSSLALPNLGARLQRQRLQFTAETLAADIADARLEAAQRGLTLHVQASAGHTWCWAIATTPGCSCGVPQACQLRRVTVADHPGTRMVQGPDVSLSADGAASAVGAALFESAGGQRVQVAVSPLGRAHLCATTGAWPTMPAC